MPIFIKRCGTNFFGAQIKETNVSNRFQELINDQVQFENLLVVCFVDDEDLLTSFYIFVVKISNNEAFRTLIPINFFIPVRIFSNLEIKTI